MFGGESYISAVSCMELNSKTSRFVCLFNSSKGHGCGCTTALCGMHRHHYRMYCLTPPTYLCSDNMQTCTDQRWNEYQNSVASKTIGQCAGNTPNTLISTSRPRQTVSSLIMIEDVVGFFQPVYELSRTIYSQGTMCD